MDRLIGLVTVAQSSSSKFTVNLSDAATARWSSISANFSIIVEERAVEPSKSVSSFHLDCDPTSAQAITIFLDPASQTASIQQSQSSTRPVQAPPQFDFKHGESSISLSVELTFFLEWCGNPFDDQPMETINLITSKTCDSRIEPLIERNEEPDLSDSLPLVFLSRLRELQNLRLVSRSFNAVALRQFYKVLGMIGHLRRSTKMLQDRVKPIELFRRHPLISAPYLRSLRITERQRHSDRVWKTIIPILQLSAQLKDAIFYLGAPRSTSTRMLFFKALSQLSLSYLLLHVFHSQCRWDTKDLRMLLEFETKVCNLDLAGWDLEGAMSIQELKKPPLLTAFLLRSCRISYPSLKRLISFIFPSDATIDQFPEIICARCRRFLFDSFFPTILPHQDIFRTLSQTHSRFIRQLELESPPLTKDAAEEALPSFPAYLDASIFAFQGLVYLRLDAGFESSNMLSPDFLDHVDLPKLRELSLACLYFSAASIIGFLSRQVQRADQREDWMVPQVKVCVIPLWGDYASVQDLFAAVHKFDDPGQPLKEYIGVEERIWEYEGKYEGNWIGYESSDIIFQFHEGGGNWEHDANRFEVWD